MVIIMVRILIMSLLFGLGYLVGKYGFKNVCNEILTLIRDILREAD